MLPKITGIAAPYSFSRLCFFLFLADVFETTQVNFIAFGMFAASAIMIPGIIMGFIPFGNCHQMAP
jgi:hypothetical protein